MRLRRTDRSTLTELDRRSSPRAGPGARRQSVTIPIPVAGDGYASSPIPANAGEMDEGIFDPQRSSLLPRFRAFHAELVRLKRIALRDPTQLIEGVTIDKEALDVRDLATAAKHSLQLLLERNEMDMATARGPEGAALFREAAYAMAALTDEIFLSIEWVGREAWLDGMIEQSMFGTQIAGEEVFRRIDRLLSSRTGATLELGAVYLLVLSLGFEGQYRGRDHERVSDYRKKLYRFLYRADSMAPQPRLVPQAYEHTTKGERPVRLPYVQRWMIVLGVTIVLYIAASEWVWHSMTSHLAQAATDIVTMGGRR